MVGAKGRTLGHAAVVAGALGLALSGAFGPANAQSGKPLTIVIPLAAGTGMDVLVRLYSEKLSQNLGRPIVVENKPGAAMMLGTAQVATAPPDGSTLLIATSSAMAINPALYKQINYDPEKDFVPIALYVKSPFILIVDPARGIDSVPAFLKAAKEAPAPLTFSSPGAGTLQHLSMEFVKQRFGVPMTHVPYRSTPQAVQDIAAGHVTAGFAEAGASLPLVKDGKLKAIAVSAGNRLPLLPDVPPFSEAAGAPDFEAVSWHSIWAPAKTPPDVVERLHAEMKKIMAEPEMRQRAAAIGLIPMDTPSVEGVRAYVKSEREKWGALVEKLGLKGSQ